MALGFYFAPPANMSTQQYDECIARLKQAGAAHPPGRVYHAAFGTSESVKVFDVWTSQEAFEKFGETLMPILQGMGVDPGQPTVMTIHNVITPPPPRAAAKKAKKPKKGMPARRAVAKKPKKKAKKR